MKSIFQKLNLLMILSSALMANGVCIVDAESASYLRLMSSTVNVQVENQVAVITATQVFKNTLSIATEFKYAFPLAEAESAIALRWYLNQQWQEAAIGTSPQDTTIPGGGGEPNEYLETYLGETPLYFGLTNLLEPDSTGHLPTASHSNRRLRIGKRLGFRRSHGEGSQRRHRHHTSHRFRRD